MASYYEKDGRYYVRFKTPGGKWSAKSTGIKVDSKGSLRKVEREVSRYRAIEKAMAKEGSEALFSSWVDEWMIYKYHNAKTLTRYQGIWSHVSIFLKEKKVSHPAEMTYQLAHEFMTWRSTDLCSEWLKPCKWNTALTELRVLGAALQEAVRRGYIIASPMAKLGITRRDVRQKRELTSDEIETIEEHLPKAKEWIQDAWLVGMKQGCRLSECAVPLSRINTDEMEITFHIKGGKTHTAPLHKDLLPLVEKARKRKSGLLVEFPPSHSRAFVNWLREIGVDEVSFHYLRVTVITRLARAGYSEQQTMAYIGHSSTEVHAIYTKLKSRDVQGLGDAL
jgi:site-specific recombinase XerD